MSDWGFPVGVHDLHPDTSLDFQLNRLATLGGGQLDEVREAATRIADLADWKREFLALAERALSERRTENGAAYLRAAEFFMASDDPDKAAAYERQAKLFRDLVAGDLSSGALRETEVPYETGYLPTWRLSVPEGIRRKGVVVIHGGFDSYAEELYGVVQCIPRAGYETVLFEGPGQGSVIRRQGIPFTTAWERPVAAVLDHLGLDDVTLIGLSLGGYLAPRAAAFLPRIKRVVAFDVCWDLFEAGLSTRPAPLRLALRALMTLRAGRLIDALTRRQIERDPFTRWAVEHGTYVFGVERPYEYLRRMREFSTRAISRHVTQDFLLLAGTDDHYMPLDHFHRQARALTNVRSLTGRVFTRAESAHTHCQCGNLGLALDVILAWIDERSRGTSVQAADVDGVGVGG
jgi:pimeloyl-ACP methyl ester carboxylesterase